MDRGRNKLAARDWDWLSRIASGRCASANADAAGGDCRSARKEPRDPGIGGGCRVSARRSHDYENLGEPGSARPARRSKYEGVEPNDDRISRHLRVETNDRVSRQT